ncbi:MAG: bifunctional demethylmenaquinone methyltransferase/2-methoxy-6-polyprenyl-1,4-benzoquinol methylase UbiE [Bacteroidia bacterium]|jgi:demethylmenaquinone methyltransferase/2-methoxy-6-polyprenyl-1,4-benzoquinol methylase|nr:bifunctional demethylmenaquinone methyltransferase/2-methoxy-6-polyprenyl-1,4-benzoquinol methylase UbiE [Bacteroidia bacterium]
MKIVKPNQELETGKKEQVEQMFDSIAPRYDLLNRLLSLGIDKGWRKKAIQSLASTQPKYILDVATGTADLAIAALALNPTKITGVDISELMLSVGRTKISKQNLDPRIELLRADSEALPFESHTFDAVTVAFGVRNFENLQKGLDEMYRVLKPGGRIAVLEFSTPQSFPTKQLYLFYFKYILPLWGGLISKNKEAYTYLPESVKHFPEGSQFLAYVNRSGFTQANVQPLTFGICSLYTATK